MSVDDIQAITHLHDTVSKETPLETKERIREELISAYYESDDFLDYLASDSESALNYLNKVIEEQYEFEIQFRNYSSDLLETLRASEYIYEIDNDNIVRQSKSNYCGPASALITVKGWNGTVVGQTDADKMNTLANAMDTDTDGSTIVWKLTRELNKYKIGSIEYVHYLGSTMSSLRFKNSIKGSLQDSRAVILHARTQYLDYYNGVSLGHYIPITAYDPQANMVRLNDPHYSDLYFERHWSV